MISTVKQRAKVPYISHVRYENLSVIPYVKNRLVFADLAVRGIREGRFDLVVTDMPYFMNDTDYATLPLKLFPRVSSLVIRNAESKALSIPFVPNDAACAAMAFVEQMKNEGGTIDLKHIDDSETINYGDFLTFPEVALLDDYNVYLDGIETYFEKPFNKMEASWNELPETNRFYLDYRARQVAERLDGLVKAGKRTLFICEYRLWRRVEKILAKGKLEAGPRLSGRWSDLSAAVVAEDPYFFWAYGLLDDYPSIVHQFYKSLISKNHSAFNKLDEINNLIKQSLAEEDAKPSFRKILGFKRYLSNRLTASRRYTPLPVAHLYESAKECLGNHLSNVMAGKIIQYPHENRRETLKFLKIRHNTIVAGRKRFTIPKMHERVKQSGLFQNHALFDTFSGKMGFLDKHYPAVSKGLMKVLNDEHFGSVMWELKPDYEIHQTVCSTVIDVAERMEHSDTFKVNKSWGSMGAGIHMKATIASKARGEDFIYIKQKRRAGIKKRRYSEVTPTVIIFSDDLTGHSYKLVHDSNSTQRKSELGRAHLIKNNDPKPDSVYSLYATHEEETYLCGGHIHQQRLSSIVSLYNRHMGVKRYENITANDEKYQCRLHLMNDVELSGFTMNELGTAWAIKYAVESILLVANERWKISDRLMDFAQARKVEIVKVPISSFTDEIIDRVRIFHNISTALKKHPDRDHIVERFSP